MEVEENVYNSTSPSDVGTLFYVNPYNDFKTEFESQGVQIKLVSRTLQCWKGMTVEFRDNKNALEDHFAVILLENEKITLATKCGGEYNEIKACNNSLVIIPLQKSCFRKRIA